jgi:hypothetical protein
VTLSFYNSRGLLVLTTTAIILILNLIISTIVGRCLSFDAVAMRALTLAFVGAKHEGDRRDRIADLMWLTYKVCMRSLAFVCHRHRQHHHHHLHHHHDHHHHPLVADNCGLRQRPADVGAFVRTVVERFPELRETDQGEALAMLLLRAHASGELRAV